MTRRSFTPEFKQECAELVTKHGYQVKQAAEAMNVGLSTLQRWLRQFRQEQNGVTPKASAITPEQIRIQELEAELRELKQDNELLKKR